MHIINGYPEPTIIKAKKSLISSGPTLMKTEPSIGLEFQPRDVAQLNWEHTIVQYIRRIWSLDNVRKLNSSFPVVSSRWDCYILYNSDIESMHLQYSIPVQVSGSTLFINVKYTRLKLRLYFHKKRLILTNFFGSRNNTTWDWKKESKNRG